MKPKVSFIRRSLELIQTFTIAGLILPSTALAGNTWDGGGGDNNWGTGNNWNPDGSPAPGSSNDLFFGGSTRLSPFNNYGAFDDWRNITFNAGASSFNLFGNAIDLFGKIENLSSNTQTVSLLSIALNSSVNEFNPVNGNLTILSTNVFTNGNQLKVYGNNGFTLSFGSGTNIQHGGSLAIYQNSTVVFNSAHSYTGDTFINAGKLQFASGGSANSSIIRIGDTAGTAGAEFILTAATGGQSVGNTIVSRLGGAGYGTRLIDSQNTSGTNALTGVIALDAALTIKQAAGGTLNLTGSFFDVKQQVLTVDTAGIVNISKPLNSSFGAGGSLVKQGNGTLILSNTSNNYTGTVNSTLNANGTQIAAGTLAIAADTSLGIAPAGAYNNVQFTGTSTLRSDATISLNANRNISIANGATASFDSNGNTFTVNGTVNGTGGALTKTGAGTLVLSNSSINTYTGATTVTTGTLQLDGSTHASSTVAVGTAGTLSGTGTVNGNATLTGNGIINKASGTIAGTLGVTGGNWNGAGAVTGLVTSSSGTFNIGAGANLTANGNLNVTGGTIAAGNSASTITGSVNYTSSANSSYAGVIAGSGKTLTMNNSAATLTLGGTNTYTGATTVTAGVLAVNGSLANTSTTVQNGGTLQGSGTIGGAVTIQNGGTLAAGNSIESLGIGTLSYETGSTFAYELQTNLYAGTPNVSGDLTYSSGTLNMAAGSILTLTDLAASTVLANGSKLSLISYFGGWTNEELFTYNATTLVDGGTFTLGANQWLFNYDDLTGGPNYTSNQATGENARFVTMTVIPEPSTALLCGLGALFLLRRRR